MGTAQRHHRRHRRGHRSRRDLRPSLLHRLCHHGRAAGLVAGSSGLARAADDQGRLAGQWRLAGCTDAGMVSGRPHPALDHRLCRTDHDGGAAHARHRRRHDHRRAAAGLAADHRPARRGLDRRNRTMDRCSGDDRAGRGRDCRHDDADAQPLARRKNHGDVGTIAPPLARSEKRGAAADDARRCCASQLRFVLQADCWRSWRRSSPQP